MGKFLAIQEDVLKSVVLTADDKILLSDINNTLAYFEREGKEYTPSLSLLAKRTGSTVDITEKSLANLVKHGFITETFDENRIRHITNK